MSFTEGMRKYHEQWTSQEPKCQTCGRPAHWSLAPLSRRLGMLRPPRILCQLCLAEVPPVQIPVYSDTPRKNPSERYDFDAWMERETAPGIPRWRQWPGYDVFLGIVYADKGLRMREFIATQFLDHPEVLTDVIDGMCRVAFEQISAEPAEPGR